MSNYFKQVDAFYEKVYTQLRKLYIPQEVVRLKSRCVQLEGQIMRLTRQPYTPEVIVLIKTATFDKDEDKANAAMSLLKKINPTFHWCAEFDEMVISDADVEFEVCNCFKQ